MTTEQARLEAIALAHADIGPDATQAEVNIYVCGFARGGQWLADKHLATHRLLARAARSHLANVSRN